MQSAAAYTLRATMPVSLYNSTVASSACSNATLSYPVLPGGEILSLEANLVSNYSKSIHIGYYANHGGVDIVDTTFCNVTLSYTHPGENDNVQVQVFLPQDTWTGRIQAIGGAGWQAGLHEAGIYGMLAAMGEGYAALGTNAGLGSEVTPENWALISPGNVNLYLYQNLQTVSLNDAAIIGKDIVSQYYGQPATYSYFTGCSQGGRQGHLLAQRYPEAYDGIAASAPAINWNEFFAGDYYATMLMNEMHKYPAPCELSAITDAMVAACDPLDGIVDQVISDPSVCDFDPYSVVGTLINCTDTGSIVNVSDTAAYIATAACKSTSGHNPCSSQIADANLEPDTGPRTVKGEFLWHGLEKGAVLVADPSAGVGKSVAAVSLAATTCSTNGTCTAVAPYIFSDWIQYFIMKNASADLTTMTHEQYDDLFRAGQQEYANYDSNDPDLSKFSARGGKMIAYHGLVSF